MLSKIYNLLKYCYEDSMTDKFAGIEFQLFIISTKALLPYEDKVGCMLDTARYKKEIDVFKYYRNGNDDIIDFYFKNNGISDLDDRLIEYKIIPSIISNTIFNTTIEEVLKIVLFFTINHNTIINALIVSTALHEYLENGISDIDDLEIRIKEKLIEFSLKDYMEKNKRLIHNKSYLIDFEKERIKAILMNKYFSYESINKYKSLQFIKNCNSNNDSEKSIDAGHQEVLNNFAAYLHKIRKGTLNPEKLKYNLERTHDLMEYLNNSPFTHPLLGRCIIIKRSEKEIILKNKLGLLRVNI